VLANPNGHSSPSRESKEKKGGRRGGESSTRNIRITTDQPRKGGGFNNFAGIISACDSFAGRGEGKGHPASCGSRVEREGGEISRILQTKGEEKGKGDSFLSPHRLGKEKRGNQELKSPRSIFTSFCQKEKGKKRGAISLRSCLVWLGGKGGATTISRVGKKGGVK